MNLNLNLLKRNKILIKSIKDKLMMREKIIKDKFKN